MIARHGGRYRLILVLLTAAPSSDRRPPAGHRHAADPRPDRPHQHGAQRFSAPPVEALMYTNTASAIGLLIFLIPFMVVAVYLSLLNFDFELLEVAKVSGASPLRAFLGSPGR